MWRDHGFVRFGNTARWTGKDLFAALTLGVIVPGEATVGANREEAFDKLRRWFLLGIVCIRRSTSLGRFAGHRKLLLLLLLGRLHVHRSGWSRRGAHASAEGIVEPRLLLWLLLKVNRSLLELLVGRRLRLRWLGNAHLGLVMHRRLVQLVLLLLLLKHLLLLCHLRVRKRENRR